MTTVTAIEMTNFYTTAKNLKIELANDLKEDIIALDFSQPGTIDRKILNQCRQTYELFQKSLLNAYPAPKYEALHRAVLLQHEGYFTSPHYLRKTLREIVRETHGL